MEHIIHAKTKATQIENRLQAQLQFQLLVPPGKTSQTEISHKLRRIFALSVDVFFQLYIVK